MPTPSQRQTTSVENHLQICEDADRDRVKIKCSTEELRREREERWKVFQLFSKGGSYCRRPCCLSYLPPGDWKRTFVFWRGEPHVLQRTWAILSWVTKSRLMPMQGCTNAIFDFLRQPVDSEAAISCGLAPEIFRCNPRRSTRQSAELVCLDGRQAVWREAGSALTGQTSGKTHVQLWTAVFMRRYTRVIQVIVYYGPQPVLAVITIG